MNTHPGPADATHAPTPIDATSALVRHLAEHGDQVGALLHNHGRTWRGSHLTGSHRGAEKRCYANAWRSVRASTTWQYAEGFAQPPHLAYPVPHAWIVDPATNTVIERTWPVGADAIYLGVLIPRDIVATARALAAPHTLEVLFGEWARDNWLSTSGAWERIAEFTLNTAHSPLDERHT